MRRTVTWSWAMGIVAASLACESPEPGSVGPRPAALRLRLESEGPAASVLVRASRVTAAGGAPASSAGVYRCRSSLADGVCLELSGDPSVQLDGLCSSEAPPVGRWDVSVELFASAGCTGAPLNRTASPAKTCFAADDLVSRANPDELKALWLPAGQLRSLSVVCLDRPAVALEVVQPPTTTESGRAIEPAVLVQAVDSLGRPIARAGREVRVELASGADPLDAASIRSAVTAEDGRASFAGLVAREVGTWTLRFLADGLAPADTQPFAIVDTHPPIVTLSPAGAHLRGSIELDATARDDGSGLSLLRLQARSAGAAGYSDVCAAASGALRCALDTRGLPDGSTGLRALATDRAGLSSAEEAFPLVDNTPPWVALHDPGAAVAGVFTPEADASDATSGVSSVTFELAPTVGAAAAPCAAVAAPWRCAIDTTSSADGPCELVAHASDRAGNVARSSRSVWVDNTPPAGLDVQSIGAGTRGRIDAGDALLYTFTEPIAPASLIAGWNGTARAVVARVLDGNRFGGTAREDRLDVFTDDTLLRPVQLGALVLHGDFQNGSRASLYDARLTLETTMEGSLIRGHARLEILGFLSGAGARTSNDLGNLAWTPSSAARDVAGNAMLPTPVQQSGAARLHF